MNTTAYQIHSYADPLLHPVQSCLKKCDPLHCTAGIASLQHRASTLVIDDPHWGERASVTLDVFDGSIRTNGDLHNRSLSPLKCVAERSAA